jgi:hypothetical protein
LAIRAPDVAGHRYRDALPELAFVLFGKRFPVRFFLNFNVLFALVVGRRSVRALGTGRVDV